MLSEFEGLSERGKRSEGGDIDGVILKNPKNKKRIIWLSQLK